MSYSFRPLDPIRLPLIQRFYKSYYPSGKAKRDEAIWTVEKDGQIIGCVRFRQFEEGQLLTGMVIQPDYRRAGIASQLMKACETQTASKPCYCFAYPQIEGLYAKQGFVAIEEGELPYPFNELFIRYSQGKKKLIPMVRIAC
ncbi:GNAT family N-acetyltransferase [Parasalinivibrio latis]|uniref:GNAT family N-acetyltransferase n=1 Tax=Parasalinivibrio latis TaxID=2952610 RepID=UPI0030E48851